MNAIIRPRLTCDYCPKVSKTPKARRAHEHNHRHPRRRRGGGPPVWRALPHKVVLMPHHCSRVCPCCLKPCAIREIDAVMGGRCATAAGHLF